MSGGSLSINANNVTLQGCEIGSGTGSGEANAGYTGTTISERSAIDHLVALRIEGRAAAAIDLTHDLDNWRVDVCR